MQTVKKKILLQQPRVVERYFRLRVHIFSSSLVRGLVRRVLRPRLNWSERKRHNAIAFAIESIVREAARSKRYNLQAANVVFNLALFFLIAERDIQTLKIDALTHPDAWQRSLCARVILLTIYELDMDKVAGNKLRQAMDDANLPEKLRQEVALCLRSVRNAQQKAQKQFLNLRNSTIAHRDPDALRQYRAITRLDEVAVIQIASDFYAGTHAFIKLLPSVIQHVGGIPGLLSQLSAQAARKS
jgi:hypothetical protein